MNREGRIVASVLQNREAHIALSPIVEEEDFSRHGWLLWQLIDQYYENDVEATRVDTALIHDIIDRDYSKHKEQFFILLDDEAVSVPNAVAEYLQLKEQGIKHRLAQCLIGEAERSEYLELMDKLKSVSDVESDEDMSVLTGVGIEVIVDAFTDENIIPISPAILSQKLGGGLVPGNQVAIYANTEVGKTLLAIAMACGLLRAGYRVLYTGNEDPMRMMLLRFYTNLSGMTKEEILANPKRAEERAIANGYNNLIFFDATPGNIAEIRRAIEKYDPHVFFTDQMANMTMKDLSKTEKNEELSIALRGLAKRYDKVSIIIHQADNDAHGKLVLEKNNMHYTNVGVQGQMDVMIGIGMNAEFEQQGKRMLCLTKNKNSGDHSVFPINIKQDTSEVLE